MIHDVEAKQQNLKKMIETLHELVQSDQVEGVFTVILTRDGASHNFLVVPDQIHLWAYMGAVEHTRHMIHHRIQTVPVTKKE